MAYRNEKATPAYDRSLLSSVPDPTRAERQEGYNVDLLDEGHNRRAPSPPVRNRQHTDQQPLTDGYGPDGAALANKEGQGDYGAGYPVAKRRWYRTRWGIIAIVIAIIIIIAAITGGAVGATRHSNHKNANGTIGGGNPSGSPSVTGHAGPVPGENTRSVVGPNSASNTISDATAGIETGSVAPAASPSAT